MTVAQWASAGMALAVVALATAGELLVILGNYTLICG